MLRSNGSAPVDFILVSTPLLLLTLSILGVAVNGYATNIAQDVAISTARFASLADSSEAETESNSMRVLTSALGSIFRAEVSVRKSNASGVCLNESTVTLQPVALGLFGAVTKIEERAYVFCEIQNG